MGKSLEEMLTLYKTMLTAREADLIEQEFTGRGEAFFHVSGAGHEGSAALNKHLIKEDWLHCHYRDKALMMARGISPKMFFYSLFNKEKAHSKGRQMNAHMSAPELNIMSLVGP
jgi:2-oxoisovalerate dehydrogenase E1 component